MLAGLSAIKQLFARHHIKPDRAFGQNFLIDENALRALLGAADLRASDTVIEIGAGVGTLTQEIAKRAHRVYTFEVDERLIPVLRKTVPNKNVHIIKENILKEHTQMAGIIHKAGNVHISTRYALKEQENWFAVGNYKIIANIPYHSTGAFIRIFLELVPPPSRAVVMVQREVAKRMLASAGRMSALSVAMQYYGAPAIVACVQRTAFYPAPRVDSAIVSWAPRRVYCAAADEPLFRLVRAGFTHPRKLLKSNLLVYMAASKKSSEAHSKYATAAQYTVKIDKALRAAHIKDSARPGELAVEQWIQLMYELRKVYI